MSTAGHSPPAVSPRQIRDLACLVSVCPSPVFSNRFRVQSPHRGLRAAWTSLISPPLTVQVSSASMIQFTTTTTTTTTTDGNGARPNFAISALLPWTAFRVMGVDCRLKGLVERLQSAMGCNGVFILTDHFMSCHN